MLPIDKTTGRNVIGGSLMPTILKRLFAPLAIPSILRMLAGFHALLFILMMVLGEGRADMFRDKLSLDFNMVLRGEVWRLVSFILLPPANPFSSTGLLFLIVAVMFLFFINDILEDAWGSDGLNAFFYLGFFGSMLGGLLIWLGEPAFANRLALSLPADFAAGFVMAAGTVAPRLEVRLFFIIPVPLYLIAMLAGLVIVLGTFSMLSLSPILALVPLLCVANYLIWVLPGAVRTLRQAKGTRDRRVKFEKTKLPDNHAFHTCVECGATESSHPEREFRVTADGDEHCDDCLARKRGS